MKRQIEMPFSTSFFTNKRIDFSREATRSIVKTKNFLVQCSHADNSFFFCKHIKSPNTVHPTYYLIIWVVM